MIFENVWCKICIRVFCWWMVNFELHTYRICASESLVQHLIRYWFCLIQIWASEYECEIVSPDKR